MHYAKTNLPFCSTIQRSGIAAVSKIFEDFPPLIIDSESSRLKSQIKHDILMICFVEAKIH